MDRVTLFDFDFSHWPAFLLAAIPALITVLFSVFYLKQKLPQTNLTRVYLLFLFTLFAWQLNESLARISGSAIMAGNWDRLLSFLWLLQTPVSMQWALHFSGKGKLLNSELLIILLYVPYYSLSALYTFGIIHQPFIYSQFWGWVKTFPDYHSNSIFIVAWVVNGCIICDAIFTLYAVQTRHQPENKKRALLTAIAYSTTVIFGVLFQAIFPLWLHIAPIPLIPVLMLSFVVVIISLGAYKIFNLAESINSELIVELMQDIILVVSPQRNIAYINSYGAQRFGVEFSDEKRHSVNDLFSGKANVIDRFDSILQPAFVKKEKSHSLFYYEDSSGQMIHMDVSAYPIVNNNMIDGLLIVGKDITDSVLVSDARLAALRAQMNPHFIFNALNSIQLFVHNNEAEKAEAFLSTFSLLMRQVLNLSISALVPLTDELKTLELYLALEKQRLKDEISYSIEVDPAIDINNILVPSLLIQPYVENAVIHGLGKRKEGKINITIQKEGEMLSCCVQDNGIGREAALKFKKEKSLKNKSYGMSITKARLELLNQFLSDKVAVKITDLYDVNNMPSGTCVEILIPTREDF